MFSPNIQNYINTSGQAAAKARVRELSNYAANLSASVQPVQNTQVSPFKQVLETTRAEGKKVFEIDLPPVAPAFGSITQRPSKISANGNITRDEIDNIIQKTSQKYDVDEKLVKAVIKQESGFNPNAKSKAGALGLMQLMPQTAQGLGVVDPLNPEQNIEGGVKYLKSMLKRFNGNKILALAAYNAGPNAVEKYNSVPPYPETQNYVKAVLKNYL